MMEARYYEVKANKSVRCTLCPHYCLIGPNALGRCDVRQNIEGKLMTHNYGCLSAVAFDPIEKKPLREFEPGSQILSIGSCGCNFTCDFCQNWKIAQARPQTQFVTVEELITLMQSRPDNVGMAYTYNEPTVFYEFVLDTAKAVRELGYKNVIVSNGYINLEPLKALLPYIDAFNIDLKAFNDDFYNGICTGSLLPVMETIKSIYGHAHLEITVLLIDGQNSDDGELESLFKWLAELDETIPIHLSRYFPAHKMTVPATKMETLLKAKNLAERYLNSVYLGNV